MEEFESSSRLGIWNVGVRTKFEYWNPKWWSLSKSSDARNREWKSSRQVRSLESGMQEFELSSDAWNREWKSSSQVRSLESGLEEFDPSSKLGIGNGGV